MRRLATPGGALPRHPEDPVLFDLTLSTDLAKTPLSEECRRGREKAQMAQIGQMTQMAQIAQIAQMAKSGTQIE